MGGHFIKEKSGLQIPFDDAPVNHTDARDVDEAAVIALAKPGHENKVYELTGNDMEDKLQRLLDRQEISDVIVRYAFSLDMRDWDAHRSCFTNEIEMDYSASIGSGGLKRYKADEWLESVKPFFRNLTATQHIAMPLEIEINEAQARCISMLHAQHYLPNDKGDVQRMIGYYKNYLVRTPQGWKINKIIQHINWNEGNWHIFELAAGRVSNK